MGGVGTAAVCCVRLGHRPGVVAEIPRNNRQCGLLHTVCDRDYSLGSARRRLPCVCQPDRSSVGNDRLLDPIRIRHVGDSRHHRLCRGAGPVGATGPAQRCSYRMDNRDLGIDHAHYPAL